MSGTYAEYATAEDTYVGHLSENLSFAQGAAIGVPYYTAAKALQIRFVFVRGIRSTCKSGKKLWTAWEVVMLRRRRETDRQAFISTVCLS